MPIYEYRCESCGHEFEKIQKLAEAALTDWDAGEVNVQVLTVTVSWDVASTMRWTRWWSGSPAAR